MVQLLYSQQTSDIKSTNQPWHLHTKVTHGVQQGHVCTADSWITHFGKKCNWRYKHAVHCNLTNHKLTCCIQLSHYKACNTEISVFIQATTHNNLFNGPSLRTTAWAAGIKKHSLSHCGWIFIIYLSIYLSIVVHSILIVYVSGLTIIPQRLSSFSLALHHPLHNPCILRPILLVLSWNMSVPLPQFHSNGIIISSAHCLSLNSLPANRAVRLIPRIHLITLSRHAEMPLHSPSSLTKFHWHVTYNVSINIMNNALCKNTKHWY